MAGGNPSEILSPIITRFCLIYHLAKECPLRRANTTPALAGLAGLGTTTTTRVTSAPPKLTQVPDVTQQQANNVSYARIRHRILYTSLLLNCSILN